MTASTFSLLLFLASFVCSLSLVWLYFKWGITTFPQRFRLWAGQHWERWSDYWATRHGQRR